MDKSKKGFTLLELLIVIAIIAILSVVLIIIIDPAETLKKSRDSQRISDLNTMKTALGIYLTSSSTPDLGGSICLTNAGTSAKIAYSATVTGNTAQPAPGNDVVSGATFAATGAATSSATATNVDGSGWIPVNLTTLIGGAPISNLPLDPVNTVTTAAPVQSDLVYRYACQQLTTPVSGKPVRAFEMDAKLESATYGTGGSDDRGAKDGGDNVNLYEVGSSVKLIGTGSNF